MNSLTRVFVCSFRLLVLLETETGPVSKKKTGRGADKLTPLVPRLTPESKSASIAVSCCCGLGQRHGQKLGGRYLYESTRQRYMAQVRRHATYECGSPPYVALFQSMIVRHLTTALPSPLLKFFSICPARMRTANRYGALLLGRSTVVLGESQAGKNTPTATRPPPPGKHRSDGLSLYYHLPRP